MSLTNLDFYIYVPVYNSNNTWREICKASMDSLTATTLCELSIKYSMYNLSNLNFYVNVPVYNSKNKLCTWLEI